MMQRSNPNRETDVQTIGLIGGMSWESTVTYYQVINREVARRLGGFHSARIVMHSVDFGPIEAMQHDDDWEGCGRLLADAARSVEAAGADFLVLATNTMHRVADAIESAVSIPLLHIADATGERIRAAGIDRVALLGTRFTMEQEFYRGRLEQRFGLQVLTPDDAGRAEVHRVIYQELVHGTIDDGSRTRYVEIVNELAKQGAGGVILGCTEIGLLIGDDDVAVPTFDTARIHAVAAVDRALGTAD
jgi:aspartate racemase